jgi:site-specific DNA-methyltransferase (adenine-specific)
MSTDYLIPSQPDILEVISNLSNDEVFTPPRVVNTVLDMLPVEVWSDPTLRWLDPGCKTGVFPREITKRLMRGLAEVIPDEAERLDHILRKMVFAIAITEITSMMARRTLYCSKDAAGDHSATPMPSSMGNTWFERISHSYVKGRCNECNASETLMEIEGRDNHAYGFIHEESMQLIGKDLGMHFDVIVGNPPYQMTGGGGGSGHSPLYNFFVDQAKVLNPKFIAMVIPSRWMAGGRGLDEFRSTMLKDRRIRKIVDFPNSMELFPTVDIKGGICYFLWDRENEGNCDVTLVRGQVAFGPQERVLDEFDVFVRDVRALKILRKVLKHEEPSLADLVSGAVPFGLTSNFNGFKAGKSPSATEVRIYTSTSGKRQEGAMKRSEITKNLHLIDEWKVLVPKAGSDGGRTLPDVVIGKPMIAPPGSICTETFLPICPLASELEARSVDSYLRTRFMRFLMSLRKISQDAMRGTYEWVPQQSWDRTWTDEELFKKYKITQEEQAYIAEMVKEMPA